MSNVQMTKWHENATTDKLNVNPPFIREEVNPPPRETQSNEYEGWGGVQMTGALPFV